MVNYDNSWLGLGDLNSLEIKNPMIHRSKYDIENPDAHLMKLMKNTDYIGCTVKMLFGIELHPIQMVILQEFWHRPFPMFIASRGFGKSFLMSLYCILKCTFVPGTPLASESQSKIDTNRYRIIIKLPRPNPNHRRTAEPRGSKRDAFRRLWRPVGPYQPYDASKRP